MLLGRTRPRGNGEAARKEAAMDERQERPQSTAELAYGREGAGQTEEPTPREAQPPDNAPLMPGEASSTYRDKWQTIQTRFVDEPREAVREADGLVAEVIQELARNFANQREELEGRWTQGSEVSTEDLRQALQQYRSFFQRLLAA